MALNIRKLQKMRDYVYQINTELNYEDAYLYIDGKEIKIDPVKFEQVKNKQKKINTVKLRKC
jgi:hypothetical protein